METHHEQEQHIMDEEARSIILIILGILLWICLNVIGFIESVKWFGLGMTIALFAVFHIAVLIWFFTQH